MLPISSNEEEDPKIESKLSVGDSREYQQQDINQGN